MASSHHNFSHLSLYSQGRLSRIERRHRKIRVPLGLNRAQHGSIKPESRL